MSLRTNDTLEKKKTVTTEPEKSESSHSDDDRFTTPSEDVALSPKRQNQKSTPPALAPQKKSTRKRQSALTNAFVNAVPINIINEQTESNEVQKEKEFRTKTDSPPDQSKSEYPSLKSLIQEMVFMDNTPQYQACLKFVEAISPKQSAKQTEVVDLTSPTEDEKVENNNDILFVKNMDTQKKTDDTEVQEDEEHN